MNGDKCRENMAVSGIFGAGGDLAVGLAGFEPREGQQLMAEAVEQLLCPADAGESEDRQARVLVVEAETGIGKTLAYLVPAILSGRKVVVSTATLNLQDQILEKEIPLVARVLGREVSALCLKGRENYLCLYRYYQYRSNPELPEAAEPRLVEIDRWLQQTSSGDRAELDWLGDSGGIWTKFSATANRCLGGECPEAADCYLNRVRRQAGAARLLIVNHHLFFSDLALRAAGYGELLPRYDSVIFDEAHHLENVATTFFGKSFSHYQLVELLGDIERQASAPPSTAQLNRLLSQTGGLRQRLESFSALFPAQQGRFHLQELVSAIGEQSWQEEVALLADALRRVAAATAALNDAGDGWQALAGRGEELAEKLVDIARMSDDHDFVHWYEKRQRAVVLSATPIEIADEMRRRLYGAVECCLLTSATLSSGGSFRYVQERLGLDPEGRFLRFASPFDYAGRSLIYVPESGFPEPAAEVFAERLAERVLEIVRLSRGRALVLCTSLKGMDALAEFLEEHLDYPLLVQGRASRNALLRDFRRRLDSVLLAVASFWEGVDIVGESLSCLIIDKLPFEVPTDPVIQARIARISQDGGKPFFAFQVPRAILTLRQGVGRLMRSATDRGVIAIMDVRLFSKGYGATFRKSLPAAPLSRDLAAVGDFFSGTAMSIAHPDESGIHRREEQ